MQYKEDAKMAGNGFLYSIIGMLLLFALGFGANYLGLISLEFFGTRKANIERKIFDNSNSQVKGTIKALSTYRMEYKMSKDADHRAALKQMMILEYDSMERKDLIPYNLTAFILAL